MLILTRRPGASIVIGRGEEMIEVVILGINDNQVKIGVEAPRSVEVHRHEIYNRIQQENKHGNTGR